MKPFITLFLAILCLSLNAQSSWTEFAEMENPPSINPGTPYTPSQLVIPTSGVDFYMDAVMFAAECPMSTAPVNEDFISSVNPPSNPVCDVGSMLNSATDNTCFVSGDIQPGFTMEASSGASIILLPDNNTGFPNSVGPDIYADNTIINFSAQVNSVALEFINFFGIDVFTFSVYGMDGVTLLGSMDITSNGTTPVFVGMLASEPISRIEVTNVGAGAELFTSLSFDLCTEAAAVPTLGQWGLISLGLMILIFGVLAVRERIKVGSQVAA